MAYTCRLFLKEECDGCGRCCCGVQCGCGVRIAHRAHGERRERR